jgi:hypothetical protein
VKKRYQVYVDRGNGLELDGCWGSEEATSNNRKECEFFARGSHRDYLDCAWVVYDEKAREEVYRIESKPAPTALGIPLPLPSRLGTTAPQRR